MKKILSVFLTGAIMLSMFGCSSQKVEEQHPSESSVSQSNEASKEKEKSESEKEDLPVLSVSWGNEMHTGILNLPFIAPELFEKGEVRIEPMGDGQGKLISDDKAVAVLKRVITKGGSECATLMSQKHLDVAFTSSTAMMTAYDVGTEVQILCPIQCDGVAIAAVKDAPFNTFEELVAYAKESEQPVKAGYHSAISSPRIVLESALKDAGLNVTEDPSNFDADILMVDLKGVQNLVSSLSSKQVEVWAGPAPHPQNAESTGVGKIISTLNQIPGGKWENFPCCALAARKEIIDNHPEAMQALVKLSTEVAEYANNNQEKTGELLSELVGVEKDILPKSLIVYSTNPDEKFTNGIAIYYDAMKQMNKFSGRLLENSFDEAQKEFFNFTYAKQLHSK